MLIRNRIIIKRRRKKKNRTWEVVHHCKARMLLHQWRTERIGGKGRVFFFKLLWSWDKVLLELYSLLLLLCLWTPAIRGNEKKEKGGGATWSKHGVSLLFFFFSQFLSLSILRWAWWSLSRKIKKKRGTTYSEKERRNTVVFKSARFLPEDSNFFFFPHVSPFE